MACVLTSHRQLAQNQTTNSSISSSIIQLSSDSEYYFVLLEVLSEAPCGGSDIGEVLTAGSNCTRQLRKLLHRIQHSCESCICHSLKYRPLALPNLCSRCHVPRLDLFSHGRLFPARKSVRSAHQLALGSTNSYFQRCSILG